MYNSTEIIKNNAALGFLNLVVGDNLIVFFIYGKVIKVIVEKNYSRLTGNFQEISKEVADSTTGKKFRVLILKKNVCIF